MDVIIKTGSRSFEQIRKSAVHPFHALLADLRECRSLCQMIFLPLTLKVAS